jgi:hypothetical protein
MGIIHLENRAMEMVNQLPNSDKRENSPTQHMKVDREGNCLFGKWLIQVPIINILWWNALGL